MGWVGATLWSLSSLRRGLAIPPVHVAELASPHPALPQCLCCTDQNIWAYEAFCISRAQSTSLLIEFRCLLVRGALKGLPALTSQGRVLSSEGQKKRSEPHKRSCTVSIVLGTAVWFPSLWGICECAFIARRIGHLTYLRTCKCSAVVFFSWV